MKKNEIHEINWFQLLTGLKIDYYVKTLLDIDAFFYTNGMITDVSLLKEVIRKDFCIKEIDSAYAGDYFLSLKDDLYVYITDAGKEYLERFYNSKIGKEFLSIDENEKALSKIKNIYYKKEYDIQK